VTNIQFIAHHLFENPGARYGEILRALCAHKGKAYGPGQYSSYMTTSRHGPGYAGRYWRRHQEGGWVLTLEGLTKVIVKGVDTECKTHTTVV